MGLKNRGSRLSTQVNAQIEQLEAAIGGVLMGKPEAIRMAVVALLSDGHILIEDAPGVGKTVLGKAMARSLNCQFRRIQFTPDLLPSDILGSSVFLPNLGEFEFREGPIFTNILLADEINRTTPRTQSALLEAMSEHQVSIEGETRPLAAPFLVLATQNPLEYEGTYPLPENQLDRFMMSIEVGYPSREVERDILTMHRTGEPVNQLQATLTTEDIIALQAAVRDVRVDDSINDYLLDIVAATRTHDELELGVSTRGALIFYRAVQGMALAEGRNFAIPDDVKRLAEPVLAHRVICRGVMRQGRRERSQAVIRQIVNSTAVPQ
ncbi:ATPase family associated with various cellular activities (AAA) [Symmachiella dynata]|uniref:ATPase family associated with various cellular activities (AAA) n=1 Tax=Symmachiella dynata TaxID=2527995 RepID=A0A517ZK65_9PLAN|nr:ATPase family associated with various cellular activities (AAA) [Symmachiella dynata]QDU42803.1 ATPase family associated with various cellular activities (AAA) [Symmachiella dynata]